jgi:hypothetical protein
MMCPPMLINPNKRIPSEITKRAPGNWCVTTTYKMFEEIVGRQLITQLKISDGKTRQNLQSTDGMMHYKKHHQRNRPSR